MTQMNRSYQYDLIFIKFNKRKLLRVRPKLGCNYYDQIYLRINEAETFKTKHVFPKVDNVMAWA